ncbi:ATP-binding protein [Flammeovirgaceae bacterium SG7u.111]|nr:ATP-binding protein [Flammeovirgaceae bacterium SG7u.132]WPO33607.1 ATP-binding protein [Flammeovirgaceae bacterium SG7u.111]
MILNSFISDSELIKEMQTYKGWFYVFVTGVIFFLFLKKHLEKLRNTEKELEEHKVDLEKLFEARSRDLDVATDELSKTNKELHDKNSIINQQNANLRSTIHTLKATQSQLFQAEKMASLGILTAGIAHEINNPLNFISGGYRGLKYYFEDKGDTDELVTSLLNSIETGIDRAVAIISGLNKLSRNTETYDEACQVHDILDNCLLMLGNELKSKIDVHKKYTDKPFEMKGNVGKIHQVFINILTNACQAISDKGEITIETDIVNNYIQVKITDTGEGIEKENLAKITDPFFTTKDPGQGTGLGLSITYTILQEHKGQIGIESTPKKGTEVTIALPLHVA